MATLQDALNTATQWTQSLGNTPSGLVVSGDFNARVGKHVTGMIDSKANCPRGKWLLRTMPAYDLHLLNGTWEGTNGGWTLMS